MNRSTRMIDTPHGPMLFSPALAHELEPGDLVVLPYLHTVGRLTNVERHAEKGREVQLVTAKHRPVVSLNCPVMRAVGARASGVVQ